MTAYPALATRINRELLDLQRSVEHAAMLMTKAPDQDDADFLDGVALNLDSNRVRELTFGLPECCARVAADLAAFTALLDAMR